MIDYCTATDGHHVYLWGQRVEGADPASFEVLDGGYFKDKSHVWYIHDLVEGADPASFKIDKEGHASDKYGPIYNGKRTEE